MIKFINKIIHKLLSTFDYLLIKKEDIINFRLDDLKLSLVDKKNKKYLTVENLITYFYSKSKDSKSQLFQDLFVDFILKKRRGTYCEVGALDGVELSNTYYLEKKLGWKGILCEPNKSYFKKIKKNRPKNIIITDPVDSKIQKLINFGETSGGRSSIINHKNKSQFKKRYFLKTTNLNNVFFKYLKFKKIDYLSIDTEGNEYEIISTLNFKLYKPKIITIEHNYEFTKREKIFKLLKNKGYTRVFKSISRFEDWYIQKNLK